MKFEGELQKVDLSNHLEKDVLPTPSLAAARAHDQAFIEKALAWLKAQSPNPKEHLTVFNTESVLKVVHALFEPAARRHRQARAGDPAAPRATAKGTNLGDRHLLLGVKGVGKTCLARGIVDYISSLGTATPLIGVYHDYSRDDGRWQRPAALIWHALWARVKAEHGESAFAVKAKEDALEGGLHEASAPSDISQFAFIRFRYFFCVAFDEIGELYVPLSDPNAQCGRRCVSDMLDIGKNAPTTAAVLTGSARMTKSFAFRLLDDFDDAIKARGQNYADLNHTVYHVLPLHPLRTQDEMEAVVGAEEAALCFYESGGIGRAIATEVPTAQALPALDTPQRVLIEALLLRPPLVRIEDDKVLLNENMVTSSKSDPWTQSYSIAYSDALDVLKTMLSPPEARHCLCTMQDAGLIYEAGSRISILRPLDAAVMADALAKELAADGDALTAACCRVLATKGGGDGDAGKHVERKILQHVAATDLLAVGLSISKAKLSYHNGKVWLGDAMLSALSDLPPRTLLSLKGEAGVDAFWFEHCSPGWSSGVAV